MPPKKKSKKKKGDKLAAMTEEERTLYLEQQRIQEEELKAKKAAMLTRYLQDKLEKEEQMSRLNQFKLIQHWRAIMRDLKSEELKRDVEILLQTFERITDRKDNIIKTLIKDMNESEEQHSTSLKSHLENIDKLIDLQNQRLRNLRQDYEIELQQLTKTFGEEEDVIISQHTKQMNNLKDIFIALDSTYTNREKEAKIEQNGIKDELKNKSLEDKNALRTILEVKVNHLWSEFKSAAHQYNKATEEKIVYFENLRVKDEKSAAEIEMQMKRLQKISENISLSKKKMTKTVKEFDEKNCHLNDEKEKLVTHFQNLKSQLNKLRESQRGKLVKLSLESGAAIKRVQELLSKAEKLLILSEHCRKYETEEEKVIPIYSSTLTAEEEQAVKEAYTVEGNAELATIMQQCIPLEMFWRRFNKVQLDRLASKKERDLLKQENENLKALLKHYLDGISGREGELQPVGKILAVENTRCFSVQEDSRVKLADHPLQQKPSQLATLSTTSMKPLMIN